MLYRGYAELTYNREELNQFFEEQVSAIFKLIDGQIQRTESTYPKEQIASLLVMYPGLYERLTSVEAYLVLSGGLGSSPYLKKRLRERYESKGPEGFSNTRDTRVLLSEEP